MCAAPTSSCRLRRRDRVHRHPRHLRRGRPGAADSRGSRRRLHWGRRRGEPSWLSTKSSRRKNSTRREWPRRSGKSSVGEQPKMPLPFVIKAPRQGSTVGVYIVKEEAELEPALADGANTTSELLVEEFIPARELTVGVLGDQALADHRDHRQRRLLRFRGQVSVPESKRRCGGGARHVCPAQISAGPDARDPGSRVAAHRVAWSAGLFARRCDVAGERRADGARDQHHPGHDRDESAAGGGGGGRHYLSGTLRADHRAFARPRKERSEVEESGSAGRAPATSASRTRGSAGSSTCST